MVVLDVVGVLVIEVIYGDGLGGLLFNYGFLKIFE